MIQVGIIDDHKLFRKSLGMLVNSMDNFEVAISADNGSDFLKQLKDTHVDLILFDIQMPIMNGFETCQVLHRLHPDIKILIVSQLTTKESIHKIMELGAHGYFTKNSDPDQLEFAMNSLNEKGYYFGTELGNVLREAILWEHKNESTFDIEDNFTLTQRELEIIKMASAEFSSAKIADILNINVRTVDTHRKNIMKKTHSKNFIGVVLFALKNNYLTLEEL